MDESLRPGACAPQGAESLESVDPPGRWRAKLQVFTSEAAPELRVRRVKPPPERRAGPRMVYLDRVLEAYRADVQKRPVSNAGGVLYVRAGDPEANRQRSHKRAKDDLRLSLLELVPFPYMLTFTTRGLLVDLDTAYRAWDCFNRLALERVPGFRRVTVFELHKSGLHWHIHAAIRADLPRDAWKDPGTIFNLMRAPLLGLWHDALEKAFHLPRTDRKGENSPGNINWSERSKVYRWTPQGLDTRYCGALARYMTKYMSKGWLLRTSDLKGRRLMEKSRDIRIVDAMVTWLDADSHADALIEALRIYGLPAELMGRFWTPPGCEVFSYVSIPHHLWRSREPPF